MDKSLVINNELYLYGDVGDPWGWGDGFTPERVARALVELGAGDVTVRINSGGGVATDGVAIYSLLKAHAGKVTVVIDGIAASAASLIAMAGDVIEMRTGAVMMIHDPSAATRGTAKTHEDAAAFLHKLADTYAAVYAERSGVAAKDVRKLMLDTTWMTADEAVANNFATKRIEEAVEAMAAFDYRIYARAPHKMPVRVRDDLTPAAAVAALNQGELTTMSSTETNEKPKPWAAAFYASASASNIGLDDLNAIVAASETREQAKDALITKMAANQNANLPRPGGSPMFPATDTLDNPAFLSQAIEGACYARMSGKAPEGAASQLMGLSLLEMGARVVQARGEKPSFSNRVKLANQVLMAGQHTTHDFPNALQSSARRVLLDSYKAAESELKKIAKPKTATDFRAMSSLRMSEMPALDLVEEGAEIKYGSRVESVESFKIGKYAKIFGLTIEALVNDDLGAFADASVAFGQASARREADLLAALFTANSGNGVNMADGAPLYGTGATRLNKAASGGALSVTTLGAGRQAMREQKGLDGVTPLNVVPKHLVVGSAQETLAEQLLASLNATQSSDVNPFAGKLSLHVEPRLPGNAWRLFADPSELATIVMAHLAGTNGPQIETRDGWTVLGMEIRAVLYFGCGIESTKGTYLNAGA